MKNPTSCTIYQGQGSGSLIESKPNEVNQEDKSDDEGSQRVNLSIENHSDKGQEQKNPTSVRFASHSSQRNNSQQQQTQPNSRLSYDNNNYDGCLYSSTSYDTYPGSVHRSSTPTSFQNVTKQVQKWETSQPAQSYQYPCCLHCGMPTDPSSQLHAHLVPNSVAWKAAHYDQMIKNYNEYKAKAEKYDRIELEFWNGKNELE